MPASTSIAHWHILTSKVTSPFGWEDPIAPLLRSILELDWGTLPDKPPLLVVGGAYKQLSKQRALLRASRSHSQRGPARASKITLHIPTSQSRQKRKTRNMVELLRGSDAPVSMRPSTISTIGPRSEPKRIKHGRRSTWVEVILVRWEPEMCTFGDELDRYRLDFDIMSITSLEENIPSHSQHPLVSVKRLDWVHRRVLRRSPLTTRCTVHFAPSPQDSYHIRSIVGGAQALDAFLAAEALSSKALDTPFKFEPRSPHLKRSSSAQAPTHNKRCTHSSPPPPNSLRGGTREQTPLFLGPPISVTAQ